MRKKTALLLMVFAAVVGFSPGKGQSTEADGAGSPPVPPRAIVMLVPETEFPGEFKNLGMNAAAANVAESAGCEVSRFYPALSAMTGHATMVLSATSAGMSEPELVEVLRKHPLVFSAERDTFISIPAPPIPEGARLVEPGERG